ncbi:MAG: carbohydrate-binding domain-containing protein [Mobilitalea sp.]
MNMKKLIALVLSTLLLLSLVGCTASSVASSTQTTSTASVDASDSSIGIQTDAAGTTTTDTTTTDTTTGTSANTSTDTATGEVASTDSTGNTFSTIEGAIINTADMFSNRDLEQTADLTDAVSIKLTSNKDVLISEGGVYVLSGEVNNVTVAVEAADDAKVQIVLDGVSITNEDSPIIYVKTADKVFITTTNSENHMKVSGSFVADGDTNLDAVIYSKVDLTFNGTGILKIVSDGGNGIASKDDLKVTGGTYIINTNADGFEANDSICIYDGDFTIETNKDAFHSENKDDTSLGYLYIYDGIFNISAADDAFHANSLVQIDGGTINVATCMEGIEGTSLQINGGDITINAKDDGINAAAKSDYDVAIEINGGTIDVSMGSGDTDAIDSNGDITVNGGTINIVATSAFDSDGTSQLNSGSVTVNGQAITEIIQSHMGGGGKRR